MKKINRFISLSTAICMTVAGPPLFAGYSPDILPSEYLTAFADSGDVSGKCGEDLTYTFNETTGTLTISGTGDMSDWGSSSSVPWCNFRENIKKVIIEDGATSIVNYAFNGYSSLTSVSIPNSVTNIGNYAFSGCSNLTSVSIPNSVTTIGEYAFHGCSGLTSVVIPDCVTNISEGSFRSCSNLTSVTIPNSVTSIEGSAFSHCPRLESVIIPKGVTSIGSSAFYECTGLKSVTIPDSVVSIKLWAFLECSSLTSVTIPDSVTDIGSNAFGRCDSLTSITIPDSVTSIEDNVFSSCDNLTEINVSENNNNYTSEDGILFNKDKTTIMIYPAGKKDTKYIIPDSVTSIGKEAFDGCNGLTSITIPDSVASIENYAFEYCSSLTSVTIPNSITSIGNYAFGWCSGLTSVNISDSVEIMGSEGYWPFIGCPELTEYNVSENNSHYMSEDGVLFNKDKTVIIQYPANKKDIEYVIPDSVTSIGRRAFSECSNLKSIKILNFECEIYDNTNTISDTATIYGYAGSTAQAYAEKYGRNFEALPEDNIISGECGENLTYTFDETTGTLTISGMGAMNNFGAINSPWYEFRDKVKKVIIEDGVTSIGSYAFSECTVLTSVTISDNVTEIGYNAFCRCHTLKSIDISKNVKNIGIYAFYGCISLESIYVDNNNLYYADVDGVLFDKKISKLIQYPNNKTGANYYVPNGVQQIENYAFSNCNNLASITLPDSVTDINNFTFCDSAKLTSVILSKNITIIGESAFDSCESLLSVNIPENVTVIGKYAFHGCSSLKSIVIPKNVTSLEVSSFSTCPNLTSVTIENGNCVLYDSNFTICNSATIYGYAGSTAQAYAEKYGRNFEALPEDNIISGECGENLTYTFNETTGTLTISGVGDMSDWGTGDTPWYEFKDKINNVIIGNGVKSIGQNAFYDCSALPSIDIASSVMKIGYNAFYNCAGLKSVRILNPKCTISAGLDTINNTTVIYGYAGSTAQEYADKYSRNFSEIADSCIIDNAGKDNLRYTLDLSTGVLTISGTGSMTDSDLSWYGFKDTIKKVVIEDGVKTIRNYAFSECYGLESVTIPDSVTNIGNYAFSECSGLTSIVIPDSVTSIGNRAFNVCSQLISITIPDSVTGIGDDVFSGCSGLTSIDVSENNSNYMSEDGVLFNKDKTTLITYPTGKKDTEYVIPDSVISIEDSAFYNCSGLTSIIIPDSVTSIGKSIFYNCSGLTSVIIPDSVTDVGQSAFYGCSGLKSVTISDKITRIKNSMFRDCSSLTSVTIPNSVTSIGYDAFYGCSELTLITIPDNVTSIESYVFWNCNKLEEVKILNPECEINDSANTISNTATIYGYVGSTAQAYAEKYNRNFESFDIYATIPVLGSKNYETVAGIESVSSSDSTVAVTVVSARKTDLSVTALKEGHTDISVKLTNGDVYILHLTVSNDGTTTSATTTTTKPTTTSTTTTTTTTTTTVSSTGYQLGDVNNDGYLDVKDASMIMKEYAELSAGGNPSFNDDEKLASDVNKDGYTTAVDACIVLDAYASKCLGIPYEYQDIFNVAPNMNIYVDEGYTSAEIAQSPVKPVLSVSRETVSLNELNNNPVVEVSVDLSELNGNDLSWCSGGITIKYDGRLKPVMKNDRVYATAGKAIKHQLYDILLNEETNSLFIAVSGYSNSSAGNIVTIPFTLPDDATYDEQYDIEIVHSGCEIFTNLNDDEAGKLMKAYLFTQGIVNGYIKIDADTTETTTTTTTKPTTTSTTTTTTTKPTTTSTTTTTTTEPTTTTTTMTTTTTEPTTTSTTTTTTTEPTTTSTTTTTKPTTTTASTTTTTTTTEPTTTSTTTTTTTTEPTTTSTTTTTTEPTTTSTTTTTTTTEPTTTSTTTTITTTETTTTSTTTITTGTTVVTPSEQFTWGKDNWNFDNTEEYFEKVPFRKMISNTYLEKLKDALSNSEYQAIFEGYMDSSGEYRRAHLDDEWEGFCHGMSVLTMISRLGMLPYEEYTAGAGSLHDLDKPADNKDVLSLITYYHLMQFKDSFSQQFRTIPSKSNKENIDKIISQLDKYDTVLVGYKKDGFGAHTVLAYEYQYGSWTWNGISYDGCICICDPKSASSYDEQYNIYFNSASYNWIIPAYYKDYYLSSAYDAKFNYINGNVKTINKGGYLSGSGSDTDDKYVARIDTLKIYNNNSVSKVSKNPDGYMTQNASAGDIVADVSYTSYGGSNGVSGYNLKDAEASYRIKQSKAQELELIMRYENCLLTSSSPAGTEVIFDKNGYVSVSGDKADFSIGMTFNDNYPTDWFSWAVTGTGSENAELEMKDDGYLLSATQLKNVNVTANNKDVKVKVNFSTDYNQVYLYEIDEYTIGVAVDTDNNGTFETDIPVEYLTQKSVMGDVDGDMMVSAVDATLILQEYALLSTGNDFSFTDEQKLVADVNNDEMINAVDATLVLQYYAYISTGGTESPEKYFGGSVQD